jgi:hypothetical protein
MVTHSQIILFYTNHIIIQKKKIADKPLKYMQCKHCVGYQVQQEHGVRSDSKIKP